MPDTGLAFTGITQWISNQLQLFAALTSIQHVLSWTYPPLLCTASVAWNNDRDGVLKLGSWPGPILEGHAQQQYTGLFNRPQVVLRSILASTSPHWPRGVSDYQAIQEQPCYVHAGDGASSELPKRVLLLRSFSTPYPSFLANQSVNSDQIGTCLSRYCPTYSMWPLGTIIPADQIHHFHAG
jgi:hypothetical protein